MSDFRLHLDQELASEFDGFGAQYNQNVYAAISRQAGVTDENLPLLESAVGELRSQFVRVFFNGEAFTDADQKQSFVRTLALAQRTGSSINVTFQGIGPHVFGDAMPAFAQLLHDAVTGGPGFVDGPIDRLAWVTVRNEPNSPAKPEALYQSQYEELDSELRRLGVRPPLRLMGGDLLLTDQKHWFEFMGASMSDLLDAYSVHIYWDYFDPRNATHGIESRLKGVCTIRDGLSAEARKPLYVTEYGARGFPDPVTRSTKPGVHQNGHPLSTTNVNAFQHAWFALRACALGYRGLAKWDAYFAKYDSGTQHFSAIGEPGAGWPLQPVYRLLRLLTTTILPGSTVVRLEGSDERSVLAAFTGPGGELTIAGLDTAGGELNSTSTGRRTYNFHNLPPNRVFRLHYWNLDGKGSNSAPQRPLSSATGTLSLTAPLHAVFALTTAG